MGNYYPGLGNFSTIDAVNDAVSRGLDTWEAIDEKKRKRKLEEEERAYQQTLRDQAQADRIKLGNRADEEWAYQKTVREQAAADKAKSDARADENWNYTQQTRKVADNNAKQDRLLKVGDKMAQWGKDFTNMTLATNKMVKQEEAERNKVLDETSDYFEAFKHGTPLQQEVARNKYNSELGKDDPIQGVEMSKYGPGTYLITMASGKKKAMIDNPNLKGREEIAWMGAYSQMMDQIAGDDVNTQTQLGILTREAVSGDRTAQEDLYKLASSRGVQPDMVTGVLNYGAQREEPSSGESRIAGRTPRQKGGSGVAEGGESQIGNLTPIQKEISGTHDLEPESKRQYLQSIEDSQKQSVSDQNAQDQYLLDGMKDAKRNDRRSRLPDLYSLIKEEPQLATPPAQGGIGAGAGAAPVAGQKTVANDPAKIGTGINEFLLPPKNIYEGRGDSYDNSLYRGYNANESYAKTTKEKAPKEIVAISTKATMAELQKNGIKVSDDLIRKIAQEALNSGPRNQMELTLAIRKALESYQANKPAGNLKF